MTQKRTVVPKRRATAAQSLRELNAKVDWILAECDGYESRIKVLESGSQELRESAAELLTELRLHRNEQKALVRRTRRQRALAKKFFGPAEPARFPDFMGQTPSNGQSTPKRLSFWSRFLAGIRG